MCIENSMENMHTDFKVWRVKNMLPEAYEPKPNKNLQKHSFDYCAMTSGDGNICKTLITH